MDTHRGLSRILSTLRRSYCWIVGLTMICCITWLTAFTIILSFSDGNLSNESNQGAYRQFAVAICLAVAVVGTMLFAAAVSWYLATRNPADTVVSSRALAANPKPVNGNESYVISEKPAVILPSGSKSETQKSDALVTSRSPDLAAASCSLGPMFTMAASRRGPNHIETGVGRQDAFSIRAMGDRLVVAAIADGVGSTSKADVAANFAVTAIANVNPRLLSSNAPWEHTAGQIIRDIQGSFPRVARLQDPFQQPSCTLVAAFVYFSGDIAQVRWLSVGDSAIALISSFPERPLMSSFLNKEPRLEQEHTSALSASGLSGCWEYGSGSVDLRHQAILLATDGCWKPMVEAQEAYLSNFFHIICERKDESHLLSAILQRGTGFGDDVTATLIGSPEFLGSRQ